MTKEKNDLLYVCSLIEFVGRLTKNRNADIVKLIGKEELKRQLKVADLNHCLTFEQVASEMVEDFAIPTGSFDPVAKCKYTVPSVIPIGSVYADLILDLQGTNPKELADLAYDVFTSFISDEISNFNASTYYENPSYLYHSYMAGELLA